MSVQKFIKKPIEVEAIQLAKFNIREVCEFCGVEGYTVLVEGLGFNRVVVGGLTLSPGDWVLKDVEGSFYRVSDSVFKETYEVA